MELTPEEWEALTSSLGLEVEATAAQVIEEVRKLVDKTEELTDKLGDIAQALVSTSASASSSASAQTRLSWV